MTPEPDCLVVVTSDGLKPSGDARVALLDAATRCDPGDDEIENGQSDPSRKEVHPVSGANGQPADAPAPDEKKEWESYEDGDGDESLTHCSPGGYALGWASVPQ